MRNPELVNSILKILFFLVNLIRLNIELFRHFQIMNEKLYYLILSEYIVHYALRKGHFMYILIHHFTFLMLSVKLILCYIY